MLVGLLQLTSVVAFVLFLKLVSTMSCSGLEASCRQLSCNTKQTLQGMLKPSKSGWINHDGFMSLIFTLFAFVASRPCETDALPSLRLF